MAAKKEEKKVFDVSKPNQFAPSASSKPVIVGHKPLIGDPMVKKDEPKEDENAIPINVLMDGEEPEDKKVSELTDEKPSEEKDTGEAVAVVSAKTRGLKPSKELAESIEEGEKTGENSATNNELKSSLPESDTESGDEPKETEESDSGNEEKTEDQKDEPEESKDNEPEADSEKTEDEEYNDENVGNAAAVGAVLGDPQTNRAAELAEIERQEKINKLVEDDGFKLKIDKKPLHHKGDKKGGPVLLLIILLFVAAIVGYILADAGFFGNNIKVPIDLIKNEEAIEDQQSTMPAQKVTPTPTQSNPAQSNYLTYKDEKAKLSFDYPKTWKLEDKKINDPDGAGYKWAELTSPSGKMVITYTSYTSGLGGGSCPEAFTCPQVDVKSVQDKTNLGSIKSQYIEKITSWKHNGNYFSPAFGIKEVDPNNPVTVSVKTTNDFYLILDNGVAFGYNTSFNSGPEGNFKTLKEAEAFLASDEYKQAKQMILSLKTIQ